MTSPTTSRAYSYLPGDIEFNPACPIASGGYGDLFKGFHSLDGNVALKRLRSREEKDKKKAWETFANEANVWRALNHANVLRFLGILTYSFEDIFLVSPWIEHGSLIEYVRQHPDADRTKLLRDVAEGLAYLHSIKVVHGDLKGANALVTSSINAVLCDFGLSKLLRFHHPVTGGMGTVRWQSPELMDDGPRSFEADVYAFGVTIYEILSGRLPFERYREDGAVMLAVLTRDERPPSDASDSLLSRYPDLLRMACRCWLRKKEDRPIMREVLAILWPSFRVEQALPLESTSPLSGTCLGATMISSGLILGENAMDIDVEQRGRQVGPASKTEIFGKRPAEWILTNERNSLQKRREGSREGGQMMMVDGDSDLRNKFKHIEALPRAKYASYDSKRPVELSSCLEGTRTEVLTRIRSWIGNTNPDAEQVFLLNGMAGTGKTTIAYTIAGQAEEEEKLGATYFFSSQGDADLRQIDKVIPTLAYQLARFDDDYKRELAQTLDSDPDLPSKTLQKQMQRLIVGPLRRLSRTAPFVFVLDALDECGERGSLEILQLIVDAIPKIKIPVRILFTSRPEPHIISFFDRHHRHRRLILHNIENAIVQADIALFLRKELAHTTFHPQLAPGWMTEQQLDLLVQDSGLLFIYAVTVVHIIHDNKVHPPQKQLELLLKRSRPLEASGVMANLDSLYLQLLATVVTTRSPQLPIEQIRDTIGTLVLLRDPLSIRALQRFLAVGDGYIRAALYPLQSVILTPESDDGVARTFHQSFPDFITNPHRCRDSAFCISVSEHEKWLAIRCLSIMLDGLHADMAGINDPLVCKADISHLTDRIKPEMSYACRFWVSHLRLVESRDPDVTRLLEMFASRCVLWWIEACTILNSINTAASSCLTARDWAQISSCSLDTTNVLNDAYRLLLANGSFINAYPLQIYVSALPFVPSATALYRLYGGNGVPFIKVSCGQEKLWSGSLAVWSGHGGGINSVAFAPDGSRVVSGSNDKTVRIWDAVSGDIVTTMKGHNDAVMFASFALNGSLVVSRSLEETRVWAANSGDLITRLKGHNEGVNAVAFSPDGAQFVTGSNDKTLRVWDAQGNVIATLEGHKDKINSVAFSYDGLRVVSGSYDKTVRIWNAISGDLIATLKGHTEMPESATFSTDGTRIMSSTARETRIWDAISGEILIKHTHPLLNSLGRATVTFSPDESRIVFSFKSRNGGQLVDATSGRVLAKFEGNNGCFNSTSFSPDSSKLVSSAEDNSIKIRSALSGETRVTLKGHHGTLSSILFSPDGSRLASNSLETCIRIGNAISGAMVARLNCNRSSRVTFPSDRSRFGIASGGTAQIRDVLSGDLVVTLKSSGGNATSIAFAPDGSRVATGSSDKTVRIWNAVSGDVVAVLTGHSDEVGSVMFSPDGSRIVSNSSTETRIWNPVSGDLVEKLSKGNWLMFSTNTSRVWPKNIQFSDATTRSRASVVAFSTDGSQFLSASSDETIRIWSAISGEIVTTLEGHRGAITSLKFSPDGLRVLSSSADKTIQIWDVVAGVVLSTFEGHDDEISNVVFAFKESRVLSTSLKEIKIWDTDTRQVVANLKGGQNSFLRFSHDGSRFLSNSGGKTVRIHDTVSGEAIVTLEGHNDVVTSAHFSPSGAQVVSASADRTVRIWDVISGKTIFKLKGHDETVNSVFFSADGSRVASTTVRETRIWNPASGNLVAKLIGCRWIRFSPNGSQFVSLCNETIMQVWDAVTGDVADRFEGDWTSPITFSSDGSQFMCGAYDNIVWIWDAITRDVVVRLEGHSGPVRLVTFSHDGSQVISSSDDKTIRVWDVLSGNTIAILRGHEDTIVKLTFSPDGSRVMSNSQSNIRIYDTISGDVIVKFKSCSEGVTPIAFSPDGSTFATCSNDKAIQVWDATSAVVITTLTGHTREVNSVSFSPDGSRIVSASDDKTIRIWDVVSGSILSTLEGQSEISSVSFSPSESQMVSCSNDGIIRIWDITSGAVTALEGHQGKVNSVAFSQKGSSIVSASNDNTVRIWDSTSGEILHTLEGHAGAVRSAAFSPEGSRVVSSSLRETRIWDCVSGDLVAKRDAHNPWGKPVAFSPDGSRVLVGSVDNILHILDIISGDTVATLKGHSDAIKSTSFSPDGSRFVSGSLDKTIRVWDLVQDDIGIPECHKGGVSSLAFARDGSRLVSGSTDKTVRVWDVVSGDSVLTLTGHDTPVRRVAFSPDGFRVVTSTSSETRIWDTISETTIATLKGDYLAPAIFSSDGSRFLIRPNVARLGANSNDKSIRIWDSTSGNALATLEGCSSNIDNLSFSPRGSFVVTYSHQETLLWDAFTGSLVTRLDGGSVRSVNFSPDESHIVSGLGPTIRIWDTFSGKIITTLEGHNNAISSVAFSPDGLRIVSNTSEETRIWDVATRDVVATLEGDRTGLVVFSPDGSRFLSSSRDKIIQIGDAISGNTTCKFKVHKDFINSISFSPDGSQFVSASKDKIIRVWNAASGDVALTLKGHDGSVGSVSFLAGGSRVTSNTSTATWIWNAVSGDLVTKRERSRRPESMQFSPNGSTFMSRSTAGLARIWDTTSGDVVTTFKGHEGEVRSASFSSEGSRIISWSTDKTVRIWDAVSGDEMKKLEFDSVDLVMVFSPDRSRFASSSRSNIVQIWETVSGELMTTLRGHNKNVDSMKFSPKSKHLVTRTSSETWVWNALSGEVVAKVEGSSNTFLNFSPDEARFLARFKDNTAQIWDAVTGEVIALLNGHSDPIQSSEFSPRGTHVATKACKQIWLWDALSGDVVTRLEGDWTSMMVFSSDGCRIAASLVDNTIRIWDTISGDSVAKLKGHQGRVNSTSFSPDGTRLVSASSDGTVRIWDTSSRETMVVLRGHVGQVNQVSFSPDGSRVASHTGMETWIWNGISGDVVAKFYSDWNNSAGFSPDGSRYVSCSSGKRETWIVNAVSGDIVVKFKRNETTPLAFSPNGSQVVSGSTDEVVRIWDAISGGLVTTLDGQITETEPVSFSLDGLRVVSKSVTQTRVWDAVLGHLIVKLESEWNGPVKFSPNGSFFASTSIKEMIRIWESCSGAIVATLKGHKDVVASVAFSPDESRLASCSKDETVRIWDVISGNAIHTLEGHEDAVASAVFSPNGLRIVSKSLRETWIWDTMSGNDVFTLHRIGPVVFSPDGSRIGARSENGTICIWDLMSGRSISKLEGEQSVSTPLSFSSDGSRVVARSLQETTMWDADSGHVVAKLKGYGTTAVAFSPDGSRFVSGYNKKTIQTWDTVTGRAVNMEDHAGEIGSVAFSPDGSQVVASFWTKTLIWDGASGRFLATQKRPLAYDTVSSKPLFAIKQQWITWENGPKGSVRLCRLPPSLGPFSSPIVTYNSIIALGDRDGAVIVLDLSSLLNSYDV